MTLYLSFRTGAVGGSIVDGQVLEGDGTRPVPSQREVGASEIAERVSGRNVLLGVHGFNVNREEGMRSLGRLEPHLGLGSSDVFLGVLWPGDYWLPVVNYPFEGDDAMDCGRRLARFCRDKLASAQSFSFFSHSLGARLVLEAVKNLDRPARSVCLTAAAINRDCLTGVYADAAGNAEAISNLASRKDWVLKVAFLAGDPIADLLYDSHDTFQRALGYAGPPMPPPARVAPRQIPDDCGYGHGDYLPPSGPKAGAPAPDEKWPKAAGFIARAYRGEPQSWP